jgi:integrase/recombinase XerD
MTDGLEAYLIYLRAKGYTEGTITWQKSHLTRFISYLKKEKISNWSTIQTEHIEAYLSYIKRRYSLSCRTRQAHLSAINGLFSYLLGQGIVFDHPSKSLKPPKEGVNLPKILTPEEVMQILLTPNIRTPIGLRDRAILELFYSSGLRRQELANLNVNDLDLERGFLRINQGKNRKDRVVPVGDMACKLLEAYLKMVRWWFQRDIHENALFLDSQKGRRLNKNTVAAIVTRIVQQSGITKKVSPHTFRHTMATHMLKNDADIRHIQAILGHASLTTTEIYTHLEIEDLKEAVRRAHPRGQRRSRPGSGQDSP